MRTRGELDEAVAKLEASKGKDWSKEITDMRKDVEALTARVATLETPKKPSFAPPT